MAEKPKPMFADLAEAILAVLENAQATWSINDCDYCEIDKKLLDNLAKQYKIYFVEPENDTEFKDWQNDSE